MSDAGVAPVLWRLFGLGRHRTRMRPTRLGIILLAALAYVPALGAAPGRMPADTKLYLYLDPGRLVGSAAYTWDTSQFAGWVPHQTFTYLWPSGPWFWFLDLLGVPDWVAHRLWIATILLAGGLGARWAARLLGLAPAGALTAALVYQLSPYVLPYLSRTSLMLLPWAGLGWMVGLTVRACTTTRWRDVGVFGLVLFTVGSPNATALLMVAPGPVVWLVHAAWSRLVPWRRALTTAARIGGVSLLVSAWWLAMLAVQARHGADVLGYSETLEAVSLTSTSVETLRGLGYWLFYIRDPYAFATTAASDYMASGRVIAAGFALVVLCLCGLALTRWTNRRYAILLVFTGLVLAVGVHPIDNPSPIMSALAGNSRSTVALAMRSSTRALPLAGLGLGLGAGALVTAALATTARWRITAPLTAAGLTVANLPALFGGGFADPALMRDQSPPAAWSQAAATLDAGSHEQRVLQLPGTEFGAYRWGYTVDPPLPGLTGKPFLGRDLLPLGSPGVMDLLLALDDRAQAGTLDPAAIAPVARFLGVDTIWVANDVAFDRFRTPRPEETAALYAAVPDGLGQPETYGTPAPNVPDVPMLDEAALATPAVGLPLAPVMLVPVSDAVPIVRAADRVVVLAGSGDGIVDAAAAGLLHGDEAVLYAADLASGTLPDAVALVIVTDSNRDRARHWRGSQDTTGFTESGGPGTDVLDTDSADQRLPVFGPTDPAEQTIAVLEDGLVVRASAYGEPFAYRPEDRPAMAVDGDPDTAWVVADRSDPVGEHIDVSTSAGRLSLLQPRAGRPTRMITAVRITPAGRPAIEVALDDRSLSGAGQPVDVPAGTSLRIEITAVGPRPGGTDSGPSAVGFAELGLGAHREVVVVPTQVLSTLPAATPVAIVLDRERHDPLDRWRSDPEPVLVRQVDLPAAGTPQLEVTLRLHARASDGVLNALRGDPGGPAADRRLGGVPDAAGRSAVDGDLTTAWTSPFGAAVGSTLEVPLSPDVAMDRLSITQQFDGRHSTITRVRVTIGDDSAPPGTTAASGTTVELDVSAPDASGTSVIALPPGGLRGEHLTLTVTGIQPATTIDRRYGEPTELPVSIVELGAAAIVAAPGTRAPLSTPPPTSCRDDLLSVGASPVPLAVDADAVRALLAGQAVTVGSCGRSPVPLAAGPNVFESAPGAATGIDVDRVVMRFGSAPPQTEPPTVALQQRTRTSRTAIVPACPSGCWLILGEGLNDGWRATARGTTLGPPRQVSGGFNGWWIEPTAEPTTVVMTWTPQRAVWWAGALTALALTACAVAIVADRRRQPGVVPLPPRLAPSPPRVPRGRAAAVGVALTAVTVLVVSPIYGVLAAAVGGVLLATRRPHLSAHLAVAGVAGLGALVLRRQLRYRYFPDAAWPGAFEDLHRPGMLAVVLLLAAAFLLRPGERDS